MARMPAARALFVLGKGLSPIWSSITSLPRALSWRATARTSKAVSALRPREKRLGVGNAFVVWGVMLESLWRAGGVNPPVDAVPPEGLHPPFARVMLQHY